ncbi:proteasome subunit alpha [Plantactinospora sp. WMMB334]|uniref:proteasome subunit alpha n=1 Tax=Plantactinospora sp. WMMB334 TaxID=3404119 RepID=UPI003B92C15D
MAMQFYASPEQIMRDRSELARKGIARGRSAVTLSYSGGVLFVAENLSSALHKVSEIYDRVAFAAVGRYNEFENLRRAGVRMADATGLSFDRRDVTGLALANAYAQTLGAIFTEQSKPFEVEICVAQVGSTPETDELYRITYDGSVNDEPGRMAMGGQAEAVTGALREEHRPDMPLDEAVRLAIRALGSVGGDGGAPRTIAASQLEVAILDRRRVGRTFRRITGAALDSLLGGAPTTADGDEEPAAEPKAPAPGPDKPAESAGSADLEGKGKGKQKPPGGTGEEKPK